MNTNEHEGERRRERGRGGEGDPNTCHWRLAPQCKGSDGPAVLHWRASRQWHTSRWSVRDGALKRTLRGTASGTRCFPVSFPIPLRVPSCSFVLWGRVSGPEVDHPPVPHWRTSRQWHTTVPLKRTLRRAAISRSISVRVPHRRAWLVHPADRGYNGFFPWGGYAIVSEARQADPWTASVALQAEASAMGFDWPDAGGVLNKLLEETGEIREALDAGDVEHARRELGDLLLAAMNLSRFLHVDPAEALGGANERFRERFARVRAQADASGMDMRSCSLEQLDVLWEQAKRHGAERLEAGLDKAAGHRANSTFQDRRKA